MMKSTPTRYNYDRLWEIKNFNEKTEHQSYYDIKINDTETNSDYYTLSKFEEYKTWNNLYRLTDSEVRYLNII